MIANKIESYIKGCFTIYEVPYVENQIEAYTLNSHLRRSYIIIDTTEDNIEIPTFAIPVVFNAIQKGATEIIYSLYYHSLPTSRSAIVTVLNDFAHVNLKTRLVECKIKGGECYYGCKGLILDKNFNPLFLTTISYKKEIGVYHPVGFKVKISQDVYSRQEELIPKNIVKKIIPYFCTTPINVHTIESDLTNISISNVKPEIWIGNMEGLIIKQAVLPSPSTANNKHFNDILKAHIDDYDP